MENKSHGGINFGVYSSVVKSGTGQDYAGFFVGDVFSTTGVYAGSDSKLKVNTQSLSNNLSIVTQLNPVSFEFDKLTYPQFNFNSGTQYGLIAQEVEALVPELVNSGTQPEIIDSAGNIIHPEVTFKTLDYKEFIPFLIGAVKELDSINITKDQRIDSIKNKLNELNTKYNQLNAKVNQLESLINSCCNQTSQKSTSGTTEVKLENLEAIVLEQNVPNPFKESTIINYFVPDEYRSVSIIFTDNLGRILKTVDLNERGEGSLKVYGENLSSGTYQYTLIADGMTIETKKMSVIR